ncbi:N-acetyltransferase domain-containing protein [Lachancea thermotolerans]
MGIRYQPLNISNANELKHIQRLIDADLSEPYSIYVYRYFLNQWPELCFLAFSNDTENPIGCVVCKYETHRGARLRGYIGMLAVDQKYRRRGIAKKLVEQAIQKMQEIGCDEIMLETEVENTTALQLYEGMGFIRLKRMFRYYLNQGDAFKLILPLTERSCTRTTFLLQPETAFA